MAARRGTLMVVTSTVVAAADYRLSLTSSAPALTRYAGRCYRDRQNRIACTGARGSRAERVAAARRRPLYLIRVMPA
jgi:hypothetical protein